MAATISLKILFSAISYIGITTVPVLFFIFISRFVNFDKWLNKRNIVFLFLIPFVTIIMSFTNKFHGLVWPKVSLSYHSIAGIYGVYEHGLWYWVNVLYSYSFIIAGTSILIISIFQYKNIYSTQIKILLVGAITPFIANIIYSFYPSVLKGIEITPICFTFTGILLTLAIFRYKLLEFSPASWETIIENLGDGILLYDNKMRIINVNQALKKILNKKNIKIGESVYDLFNKYPEIRSFLEKNIKNKKEELIILKNRKEQNIEISFSHVLDKNNEISIHLLTLRDITVQRQIEKERVDSKPILSDVYNFLPDATFAIDKNGRVIAWNKAMEELTNIRKEEILGEGDYKYAIPFYGKARPVLIDFIFEENQNIEKYYDYIELKDGKLIAETHPKYLYQDRDVHLWAIASPLYNSNGNTVGAIESIRDITERKTIENELKYISFHDILTGLYNRAYFDEEVRRLSTSRELPLSIIVADINGLKLLNDVFGHKSGDALLKHAAEIIKNCCRVSDVIARWGGDEFVILLPSSTSTQASKIIKRIKEKSKISDKLEIPVSISLGFATKFNIKTSINEVLKEAENKMYKNKLSDSKNIQNLMIQSITKKLYEKNIEIEEYTNNVVRLSLELGKKIGLAKDSLKNLDAAARLYNIGKITIDEHILTKKEKLNKEEWEIIKKQSDAGYRIARSSSLLAPISEYIHSIREWWNGEGYPQKLKGDNIPLISRIITIADAYESMLAGRPYRKAKHKIEAISELKKLSGIQFDPRLVKKFLKILQDKYKSG